MSLYDRRYSHHAKRALYHARLLTSRFHHPRVDTGHLFLGVLLAKGSIGSDILMGLHIEQEYAEEQLALLTLPIDDALANPPHDAALDSALALAADEAQWLGHHYIGTQHFLLGITRTNVGNVADLLPQLEIKPQMLRRIVRKALQSGATEYNLQLARRNARLSELSRRVINAAEQLAIARDHQTVGLGHLLVILQDEARSPVSQLLQEHGLTAASSELILTSHVELALASLEVVIMQAVEVAQHLGSHYTGTEHLLMALITDPSGVALLTKLDIQPGKLKQALEKQLL